VLVNPANVSTAEATLRDIPEAARALGLRVQVFNASTSREIDTAFATLAPPTGSSSAGEFNLRRSRRAMGFHRPTPRARKSKPAG
jgi:hypothetical protein